MNFCYNLNFSKWVNKKKDSNIPWKYCESLPTNILHVKCKFCSHVWWGGKVRTKHHLVGTKKDVIPCRSVPDEVKEIFLKLLKSKERKKEDNKFDCVEVTREVSKGKNDLHQMKINASYKNKEDAI